MHMQYIHINITFEHKMIIRFFLPINVALKNK